MTPPSLRSRIRNGTLLMLAIAMALGIFAVPTVHRLGGAIRETLLCHGEREIRRGHTVEQLRRLNYASPATSTPGEKSGARVFTTPGGIKMETAQPAVIALMEQLEEAWPRAISFAELEPCLSEAGFSAERETATLLMHLTRAKLIQLHAWKAPVAATISERPRASASARQEARSRPRVSTLLHTTARVDDPVVRSFLRLLDGTRDRIALIDALKAEHPALPAGQIDICGFEAVDQIGARALQSRSDPAKKRAEHRERDAGEEDARVHVEWNGGGQFGHGRRDDAAPLPLRPNRSRRRREIRDAARRARHRLRRHRSRHGVRAAMNVGTTTTQR